MLTDRRITLVEQSFHANAPMAAELARRVHVHLSRIDASARAPFAGTFMTLRRRTLTAAIGLVADSLREMQRIMPTLASLGAKHAGYGVTKAHYATVDAALPRTLRQGLGEAFTPEVRAVRAAVYRAVAQAMQAGAAERARAA